MNTEEPTSVEKGTHRRASPAPDRVCFAGAGARREFVPPVRLRSSEDRVRIRALLRLGSGNSRKMDTEEPNSVEKGTHRRKSPVPVSVVFAGAGARWDLYLRRAFVRRRTASESALSSGQHSLAGGRRIPKSPTPLRGALTGGRHQLPLGFASPEQVRGGDPFLRLGFVRRRTACESALSSGQHSLAGGR